MSYRSYDYCKFEVDSADPVETTDWDKLVFAMRWYGDRVWRIRYFDGRVFYRLKSYKHCGSVPLSVDDARRLVKEYKIELEAFYVFENGDTCSDDAYIDPTF